MRKERKYMSIEIAAQFARHILKSRLPKSPYASENTGCATAFEAYNLVAESCGERGESVRDAIQSVMPELFAEYWMEQLNQTQNNMGTRAIYTFKDERGTYSVYGHWDGYPDGALLAIQNSLSKSWELPRFEADEFGAAFIAANKASGGDIHLMNDKPWRTYAFDIEYHYDVYLLHDTLFVNVHSTRYDKNKKRLVAKRLFTGSLSEAIKKFSESEDSQ